MIILSIPANYNSFLKGSAKVTLDLSVTSESASMETSRCARTITLRSSDIQIVPMGKHNTIDTGTSPAAFLVNSYERRGKKVVLKMPD